MDKSTFLSNTRYLKSNLGKIGISLAEARKLYSKVEAAYVALLNIHLYGDAYSTLQKMDSLLYYLLNDEPLDDDELDEILCFYRSRFE